MITEFELEGVECAKSHGFHATFRVVNRAEAYRAIITVANTDLAAYRDRWINWGWDELMKFLAYNFVDKWDTQDTYARYSLLEERPSDPVPTLLS